MRDSKERPTRRSTRTLAALLSAALFLAGCTGTHEEQSPTLLVVSVLAADDSPQLALVQDDRSARTAAERFAFVPSSGRPLAAPAVALDFTDREAGRAEAWVLTRAVAGGAVTAYLERFATAEIDPSEPSGFRRLGTPLVLTEPGGGGLLDEAETGNGLVCPAALQSSRGGDWLLVLDTPAACDPGSSDFPVMWHVDVSTLAASPLRATGPTLGVAPYVDQGAEPETGYFLVGGTSNTQVYQVSANGVATNTGLTASVDPGRLRAAAGTGSTLVTLDDEKLVITALSDDPASDPAPRGPVATLPDARAVVADPLAFGSQTLVIATRQVVAHRTFAKSEEAPRGSVFVAASGAIDAPNGWGYLLGEGRLLVVDFLASEQAQGYRGVAVDELRLPKDRLGSPFGVIDWVRAAEPR